MGSTELIEIEIHERGYSGGFRPCILLEDSIKDRFAQISLVVTPFTLDICSPDIECPGPGYEPRTTTSLRLLPENCETSTMLATFLVSAFRTQNRIWQECLA